LRGGTELIISQEHIGEKEKRQQKGRAGATRDGKKKNLYSARKTGPFPGLGERGGKGKRWRRWLGGPLKKQGQERKDEIQLVHKTTKKKFL